MDSLLLVRERTIYKREPNCTGHYQLLKIIIAGSRKIKQDDCYSPILEYFEYGYGGIEIVCGGADGPDTWGELWAIKHNVPVKYFPADWKQYGKRAGFIRNEQMAHYSDKLLALWDGSSRGTRHMIDSMLNLGKPVRVEVIKPETAIS